MKKLFIIILFIILSSPLLSVTTKFIKTDSYGDFISGTYNGLEIKGTGSMLPSLVYDTLKFDASSIWSVVEKEDKLYVASATEGKIFVIQDKKIIKTISTKDLIVSLLFEYNNSIYAATIPDGNILKIDGDTVIPIAQKKNTYFWSYIKYNDSLYLGSGPDGILYNFDGKNLIKTVKAAGDNILSLASDNNNIYLGMSDNGVVYKYNPQNNILSSLYKFDEKEIKSMLIMDNNLFVMANGVSGKREVHHNQTGQAEEALMKLFKAMQSIGSDAVKNDISESHDTEPNKNKPIPSQQKQPVQNHATATVSGAAMYKLNTETLSVDKILLISKESILSASINDSNIILGTEPNGKIYSVNPFERKFSLLADLECQSIFNIVSENNHKIKYISTSNPAGVLIVKTPDYALDELKYISKIFDLKSPSLIGKFEISPDNKEDLYVRGGNTDKPDSTWTDWTSLAAPDYKSTMPLSQFVQFYIKWNDSSEIDYINFFYLSKNHRPVIKELRVDGDEQNTQNDVDKVRKSYLVKISWATEDIDNDNLQYSLSLKDKDSEISFPLKSATDINQNFFTLQTSSIPDGWYTVKLSASDKSSNPADDFFISRKESNPFLIDNTNPVINNLFFQMSELESGEALVTGSANDNLSNIVRIDYSLDGGDWVFVYPADKIYDSKTEIINFNLDLKSITEGTHLIIVRAVDSAGNIGSAKLKFKK